MILSKKQLFDLEVKGQGPTKVITVCDTPPYGHAPTYQISLNYLERQKCYGPDKKILQSNLSIVVTWRSLTKLPLYTGDLYMKGFDYSTKYSTVVVNKHF
jgi:hypothetical protein